MSVRDFDRSVIVASLAIGSIALLMIGAQPAVLGELVERKMISLEGVGLVAMGEIIAIGVGVALSDALAPTSRLRLVAILAALATAAFDAATLMMATDAGFLAMRALAGLGEGVLVWIVTCVIVRTRTPERLASIFLVVQTLLQAAATALLALAIIPRFGWPGAFLALGVASAAVIVLAPFLPTSLDPLAPKGTEGLRVSWTVVLHPRGRVLSDGGDRRVVGVPRAARHRAQGSVPRRRRRSSLGSSSCRSSGAWRRRSQSDGSAPWRRSRPGRQFSRATALAIHVLPVPAPAAFVSLCALFGFVWLFLMPFHIGLAFRADAAGRVAVLVPAAQLVGQRLRTSRRVADRGRRRSRSGAGGQRSVRDRGPRRGRARRRARPPERSGRSGVKPPQPHPLALRPSAVSSPQGGGILPPRGRRPAKPPDEGCRHPFIAS